MKTNRAFKLAGFFLLLSAINFPLSTFAQGTAFTYQGRLNDGANAANGTYDLQFTIYDSTNLPGTVVAGPLTNAATTISNGLFTVALDFGAGVFAGPERWLEIGVRTNGAVAFTTISPRQNITPTPYAISAATLDGALRVEINNTNGAPNVVGGSPLNQVDPGVVGSVIAGGGATNYGGALSNRVAGSFSVVGGGSGNLNQAFAAVISGGFLNQIQLGGYYSGIGSGLLNTNGAGFSVIAGGQYNVIEPGADSSSIGGGWLNYIQSGADQSVIAGGNAGHILSGARESFIGGGFANGINTNSGNSFIGGGGGNTIGTNSGLSTIAGGANNSIQSLSPYATIAGGVNNRIEPNSDISMIAGGHDNAIQSAAYAFIGGGGYHVIESGAFDSVIAGGGFGRIQTNSHSSVIGGGGGNTVQTNAPYASIGGGSGNIVGNNGGYATISGGLNNSIQPNSQYATIGGGVFNMAGYLSTIGGGQGNNISNAFFSTIGGGVANSIGNSLQYGTIGGGTFNRLSSFAHGSTIAGGWSNSILFNVQMGMIGGGFANSMGGNYSFIGGGIINSNNGYISVIAGGENNSIDSQSDRSVIGGGGNNQIIGSQLLSVYGAIGGGQFNLTRSNSVYPTIGGGFGNTVQTNAAYATIPGGLSNTVAGAYSFAAGNRAGAMHDGTFVWSDASGSNFSSSSSNQFLIRAGGGVGIGVTNPATALEVAGTIKATAFQGSASGLSISADNISSGTLADARLSANVALLNASQTFSGGNNFAIGQTFSGQIFLNSTDGFRQSSLGNFYVDAPFNGGGRFSVMTNGNVGIGTNNPQTALHIPFGTQSFGSTTRQMLNLWSTGYGIGVQAATEYFRSDSGFSWFTGGVHNDGQNNPGAGGVELMRLSPAGARILGVNNWDVTSTEGDFRVGNDSTRFKIGVATNGGGAGDVWMRAHGGTGRIFVKTPGGTTIYSNEGQTLGVSLAANGTAWASVSDRNAKKDFAPIDSREILEKLAAMPITQWHYKWEEESITPHIGPMAQDFKAAFYPGTDDKTITTQEADGVALAAIQGLNQKLEQKETEITELKQRLAVLEKIILSQKSN